MDILRNLIILSFLSISIVTIGASQCSTWIGIPQKEDAENAHSIYRQALKAEDYKIAFENWKKAYELAPAADGKRDYHFMDGVKLYKRLYTNETDAAKKKEYVDIINRLYDEAVACYEAKGIKPSTCKSDECYTKRVGYVWGRKGFDMFYTFNAPYSENLAVFDKALEKAGNSTEYIVFDPISAIVVYQFQKGKMTKDQVLSYWNKMEAIAEHNHEHNKKLGKYYDQAWKAAQAKFGPIETDIFDCDYFKPSYKKMYEENPDDYETLKNVLGLLKKRGCPETDPFVAELDKKWKVYAAEENARRQAEFEANNPGVMAKKLYDEGDYKGACAKYDEAIAAEPNPEQQASYLFSKASIQFRKQDKYAAARATAYEAAKLKPGWGRPYMLIGDMYASTARSCGDHWNQRLAIIAAIDKYNYAASIDPEVSGEASDRARKYYSSLPAQDEGFMRGVKAGDSVKVNCWIGETVKVRYN